jgi:Glutathione S-transferase, N-terminal domain
MNSHPSGLPRLLGTVTSPFVRRVRIACATAHIPCTLVDTTTDDGARLLAEISPIGKVPAWIAADETVVFDSRVIVDTLIPSSRLSVRDENLVNLIDEATLTMIRLFYFRRDGVPMDAAYMQKEIKRSHTIMMHLESMSLHFSTDIQKANQRVETALVTSLDWMDFRSVHDVAALTGLQKVRAAWSALPLFASTKPGVAV